MWWVRDKLDIEAMKKAAAVFVGFHDFRGFTAADPDEVSTKVKIDVVDVVEAGDLVLVRIRGSHFLWKMVRRLVGVIVEVGRGRLTPEDAERLLGNPAGLPAELTAPPSGLYLEQVIYEEEAFDRPLIPAFAVPSVPPLRRQAPPPSWKVDEGPSTGEGGAEAPRKRRPAAPPRHDDRTRRYVPGQKPSDGRAVEEERPRPPARERDEGAGRTGRHTASDGGRGQSRSASGDGASHKAPDRGRASGSAPYRRASTGGGTYRKPAAEGGSYRKPPTEGGSYRKPPAEGGSYRKPYPKKRFGEEEARGRGGHVPRPEGQGGAGRGRREDTGGASDGRARREGSAGESSGLGRRGSTGSGTYRKPPTDGGTYRKPPAEGGTYRKPPTDGGTYRKPYPKKTFDAGGRRQSGSSWTKPAPGRSGPPPQRRGGPRRRS